MWWILALVCNSMSHEQYLGNNSMHALRSAGHVWNEWVYPRRLVMFRCHRFGLNSSTSGIRALLVQAPLSRDAARENSLQHSCVCSTSAFISDDWRGFRHWSAEHVLLASLPAEAIAVLGRFPIGAGGTCELSMFWCLHSILWWLIVGRGFSL
jgi:hypothetical protein